MHKEVVAAFVAACVWSCKKSDAPAKADPAPKTAANAKSVDPSARNEPRKTKSKDPMERLWHEVAESRNGCEEFDYFPDGGMHNMACHLKTIVSYDALRELAPSIWRGGPHGSVRLRLDAENDFGRYDPAFVRWLVEHAIPAADDATFRTATQGVYDRIFKNLAHVYLRAAVHLKKSPDLLTSERAYLESYMAAPNGQRPLDKLSALEPPELYNLYGPALGFWIRRDIDKTAPEFERGLRLLMKTYDAESIRKIDSMEVPRVEIEEGDEGEGTPRAKTTPVDDGPIDRMIVDAWKRVGTTPIACPDQFEYRPGGMRVGYCYVVGLLDMGTLKRKIARKIFVKGPHREGLQLEVERDFGHYDPMFVRWMIDHAIPASKNSKLRVLTQNAYDDRFRVAARTFYAAKLHLEETPTFFDAQKKKYESFIESGGDKPYWGYWEKMPGPYEAQAIGGSGLAFWLRRSMDGTDGLFKEALEKLLKTYDAEFLEEAKRVGFAGLSNNVTMFEAPRRPEDEHPFGP